jgi:hypothetical protein
MLHRGVMNARLLMCRQSVALLAAALPAALACSSPGPGSFVPMAASGDAGVDSAVADAREAGEEAGDAGDAGDTGVVYQLPPAWSGGSAGLRATGEEAVSMAIDASRVYWQTPGGAVFACPLTGCSHQKPGLLSSLIGPASGSLETLTASGGITAFLSNSGTAITALQATDPSAAATTLQLSADAGFAALGPLVSDTTQVYFAEQGQGSPPAVYSCPLLGACTAPKLVYTSSGYGAGPLFVSGSSLYVVDCNNDCSINVVPVQGGTSRTVCSSSSLLDQVQALHVAGGYAYFTSAQEPRSIYQCPTAGAASPSLYIKDF